MWTDAQGILEINVQTMLLRLALSASCRAITSPHVGRISPLIPLPVLLPATTMVMFWKTCVTLERSLPRTPSTKTGGSTLFFTGFLVVHVLASHR